MDIGESLTNIDFFGNKKIQDPKVDEKPKILEKKAGLFTNH